MKAVIFDMDGVIVDSELAVLFAWRLAGMQLGLRYVGDVFFRCIGVTIERTREIFAEAYPDADFDDFDAKVRSVFRERYGGGKLPIKSGVRDILWALKKQGVPLALASSTRTETVREELYQAGLLGCFDVVLGGDQVSRSKPDPEIFLTAAARLGAAPEDCFVRSCPPL